MASGFPFSTGQVLSATNMNGLTSFTVGSDQTADYTPVIADQYQALIPMNKATAVNFTIPTNASVADAMMYLLTWEVHPGYWTGAHALAKAGTKSKNFLLLPEEFKRGLDD